MDEADSILIITLRQLGCPIDDSINSFSLITPEVFMNCCIFVLERVDKSFNILVKRSLTMHEKIQRAMLLATSIKVFCFFTCSHSDFLFLECGILW